jgi:5'-3' exonuclease
MNEPLSIAEKSRVFSLFENMTQNQSVGLNKTNTSDVLLVDFYNIFIRSFCAIPTTNVNGLHVGGIAGFLKTVGAAIKLLSPSKVIIVIDGNGGSMKRRKLYPDYKSKRKTSIRVNRSYEDLSSTEIEESGLKKQLLRTIDYLNVLPVTTISIDNVEADDVIAYIARDHFKDSNCYILSCDKDFLQLVDDRVKVWNPSKKKLYGSAEIYSEYGISSENFINYRILEGDSSDNIDGIKGAGLKTIKKCFPMLSENKKCTLQEIYNACESNGTKYKLYNSVLENKDKLDRNLQLMQLTDTQIQSFSQLRIKEILDAPTARLNRMEFLKLVGQDGMRDSLPNSGVWISEVWSKLSTFVK